MINLICLSPNELSFNSEGKHSKLFQKLITYKHMWTHYCSLSFNLFFGTLIFCDTTMDKTVAKHHKIS